MSGSAPGIEGDDVTKGAAEFLMAAFGAVPPGLARRYGIVPLEQLGAGWILGVMEPDDPELLDVLQRLGLEEAELRVQSREVFERQFASLYAIWSELYEFVMGLKANPIDPDVPSIGPGDQLETAPAVRYVKTLLESCFAEGATDIHLDPNASDPILRLRVDGILVARPAPPAWLYPRAIGRIKALAGMSLGEALQAQDGTIAYGADDGARDLRVSIVRTERGESLVLRVLSKEGVVPELSTLGLGVRGTDLACQAARETTGLIVIAGPTGAGKTTTLHALVSTMDAARINIVSIEDPIEIRRREVRQIPIRTEAGVTFATVLRAVLRQDPDVIVVGEARDPDTASLVLQAAQAGHLVLTTVHASTTLGAFGCCSLVATKSVWPSPCA